MYLYHKGNIDLDFILAYFLCSFDIRLVLFRYRNFFFMKFKEFIEKYKDYYLVDGIMYLSFIIVVIILFVFFY
jgi:preprotein translocase subunit SecY